MVDQRADDLRIEPALRDECLQMPDDFILRQPAAVGAVLRERLKNIGDADDARFQMDLFGRALERIAQAEQIFMVIAGPDRYRRVAEYAPQNPVSVIAVPADAGVFPIGQRPRLFDNGLVDAQLADVVQQARD
jgi:hypothetical protein